MSGGRVRLFCAPCGEEPQGAPFYSPAKNARLFNSCPPCENPTKILRLFAGALFGRVPSGARREGCEGRCRAGMTTLPSAPFNRLPWSRRRKERRRQRSRFLPTMAKTPVRRARTPRRGDAHNARLTPLHRGGEGGCGVEPLMSSQHAYFLTSSRTRNEVEWRDPPVCCNPSLARGFLASLRNDGGQRRQAPTSPRWGSCAASSKCSCKQAFLLASDGMTVSVLTVSCPPYVIPPALISCILPAAPYNGGIIFSEERI